jgi:hypothetical protein
VCLPQDEQPTCIPKWQQCGKARQQGGKKSEGKEAGAFSLRTMLGLNADKGSSSSSPYKTDYQCCEGTTCQYTYEGCKAGRFVCKPKDKCVKEEETCGGSEGGHCCKGERAACWVANHETGVQTQVVVFECESFTKQGWPLLQVIPAWGFMGWAPGL